MRRLVHLTILSLAFIRLLWRRAHRTTFCFCHDALRATQRKLLQSKLKLPLTIQCGSLRLLEQHLQFLHALLQLRRGRGSSRAPQRRGMLTIRR